MMVLNRGGEKVTTNHLLPERRSEKVHSIEMNAVRSTISPLPSAEFVESISQEFSPRPYP
jgi:hypothetical protein